MLKESFTKLLKKNYIAHYEKSISTSSLLWLNNKHFGRPESFEEKEDYFLYNDKVPRNYQLIYKAPMESYVKWVMHIYTATAAGIGIAAIYQVINKQPILEPINTFQPMQSDDIYYFAAGFLALSAALRLVVYIYPLRIYKSREKYLAVYHPQLPLGRSHHHFEKGQVKPERYKFSPWNHITYKLGKKPSLLLDDYFKTPSEFHEMQSMQTKK